MEGRWEYFSVLAKLVTREELLEVVLNLGKHRMIVSG